MAYLNHLGRVGSSKSASRLASLKPRGPRATALKTRAHFAKFNEKLDTAEPPSEAVGGRQGSRPLGRAEQQSPHAGLDGPFGLPRTSGPSANFSKQRQVPFGKELKQEWYSHSAGSLISARHVARLSARLLPSWRHLAHRAIAGWKPSSSFCGRRRSRPPPSLASLQ